MDKDTSLLPPLFTTKGFVLLGVLMLPVAIALYWTLTTYAPLLHEIFNMVGTIWVWYCALRWMHYRFITKSIPRS